MQELTRIFTVEITVVDKGNTEDLIPHEEAKIGMEKDLKKQKFFKDAADIKVVKVQDFARDIQTNFEKMKGMNRKELAEFLTEITDACVSCGGDEEKGHGSFEMQGICPFGKCKATTASFRNWLDEEAKV